MGGLRQLRADRQLTLEAVSVLAGVDIGTISRLARGVTEAKPDTIVKPGDTIVVPERRF